MIAFGPIVAALKSAGFAYVEGVLEMAALIEAPRVSPALFIVPERNAARPNSLGAGAVDQRVTETFSVVLIVQITQRNPTVSEDLVLHSKRIEETLVGWKHPDASGVSEYVGGRLVSVDGPRVTWAMSFSLARHIRKTSQ